MVVERVCDLPGWPADDHDAALAAYRLSYHCLPPGWPTPPDSGSRAFFEQRFGAVATQDASALLTGYYEPVLAGSRDRAPGFTHPLYAPPPSLSADRLWQSRAEIESRDSLAGHEIVWVTDAVEAFFAQVQGSVRVALPDGTCLRLGFADRNGHPYRSIGAELIARGAVPAGRMSMTAIRDWCRDHPRQVPELLAVNPSFVFFRVLDLSPDQGPLGATGLPLIADRSAAFDPAHVPFGAPVWIAPEGGFPAPRLTIAQDQGSAIRGPGRADLFCGTGSAAGQAAGQLSARARLHVLRPRTGGSVP